MIANSKKITDEQYEEALKAVETPQAVYDFIMESKQAVEAGKQQSEVPKELVKDLAIYSIYTLVYVHDPQQYEIVRNQVESGIDIYIYFDEDKAPYVYRPLMRSEFSQARKHFEPSSTEFEELIVMNCVIVPKFNSMDVKTAKAGLISKLAKLIMSVSGFDDNLTPIKL